MATKCAGNLVAKHSPRQCEVCGRVFVPHSGRALYCRMCRIKGYKWIKEQRKRAQAQIKAKEVG
jgi:uncharacterized OB-fold protein